MHDLRRLWVVGVSLWPAFFFFFLRGGLTQLKLGGFRVSGFGSLGFQGAGCRSLSASQS